MNRPDPPTDASVHAPSAPARALAGSAPDHPDGPAAAGRFITFEGIDGAGKSTHLQSLAQALLAAGHAVELTREPGGTPLAESLRDLFLVEPMDALTEALLVFAGRRDHLARRIRPALSAGRFVISDRFTDATFAYQGAGRGFDAQVLAQLECWVQQADDGLGRGGLLQPDLTLWFDLPAETAARRRAAAREADRLEREDIAFFERVRQGYAQRASAWPDRVARIDASQAPEAVWQQVQAIVAGRGWL